MARGPIPDKAKDRPTVPDAVKMAQRFYRQRGHGCGGSLHIVLDDGNLEDANIQFCRDWAQSQCHCGCMPCQSSIRLCDVLLAMTRTQRQKVYEGTHDLPQSDDDEDEPE